MTTPYPIGIPGKPWTDKEKAQWLAVQQIRRSYTQEVAEQLDRLPEGFAVEQYGQLDYGDNSYPLYGVKSPQWQEGRPTVLVTGGVHGYETSGVQGALGFLARRAKDYNHKLNLLVAPCISPWAYETINRWNPEVLDPNRNFTPYSPVPESALLMAWVQQQRTDILAHIDLHETTDSDNAEFRPALAARDGITNHNWNIPDGFYLVGDSDKQEPDFQQAVLDSVSKVTHIADADHEGKLIGTPIARRGLIYYPTRQYGLCIGFSEAKFKTTTEVYPDSPRATPEQCNQAQIAAVIGALDYILKQLP
ncbi:M14 family metallopeptidase [Lacimicrobium alkaliphilum]|uniref:Peptidase n=1 Tax=Lacimicrobium alkaliphilum TaxID=1526571 RepID=A0A0U2JI60_9ALTE|nr:M14 family metallocarboxypeptidase [Lacimicrobium alkaliphilum]ALS96966.1 peptidase [Lacimicrobium alkaliphilum]